TFNVSNDTAYSYWNPKFYILLMKGEKVAGISQTDIQGFDSGEERDILINWFGTLPTVSKVQIVPEVNIFDVDEYSFYEIFLCLINILAARGNV
ncbi:MAG: hypothetical protein KKD21_12990, partial [Proteobacteria bacterium]|nr:hypothetical protein [Pseudomonadota bacterium]MBU1697935.1 hypothetical protein [Pseudomonadota bacterium]